MRTGLLDVANASSPSLPGGLGFSLVRLTADDISAKPSSNLPSFFTSLNLLSRVHNRAMLDITPGVG